MTILDSFPEIHWIKAPLLKQQVIDTWTLALAKSELTLSHLAHIPFTLLCKKTPKVSFLAHKRAVVHIAKQSGETFHSFFGDEMPIDMDVLLAGAILADVGKLLEYTIDADNQVIQSRYGTFIRHPFSGVSLAEACGVPVEVCHIIATHAHEGDLVQRTPEATIVHHADFMAYLPFKNQ